MAKVDKQELYRLQALPLDEKIAIAQKAIREFVEHFGVDGIYISFSGGKDSTVLIHLCRQLYPDLVGLYSDTGLEFPEIRDFVQTFDNITIVTPKMHHREMLKKCGYPVVSKEQAEWIYRIRSGTSSGAEHEDQKDPDDRMHLVFPPFCSFFHFKFSGCVHSAGTEKTVQDEP